MISSKPSPRQPYSDDGSIESLLPSASAYSHGLEAIYALESVDVRSIRRITPAAPTPSVAVKRVRSDDSPEQLEFDFGFTFRRWLEPLFLDEPIRALKLTAYPDRLLKERGVKLVRDLLAEEKREILLKGMGQGHCEEIRLKLEQFIAGRSIDSCRTIDFASLLRSLLADIETKKAYLWLQQWQLESVLDATAGECAEARQIPQDKRKRWCDEVTVELRRGMLIQKIKGKMSEICAALLLPWMQGRLGIASKQELIDRMTGVSLEPGFVGPGLKLLIHLYDGAPIIGEPLLAVESTVYCVDPPTANLYTEVLSRARSYFYKGTVAYPLTQLVGFLMRDFARDWTDPGDDVITATITRTAIFRVRKDNSGQLLVRLA